ncbi:MAG: hypothetical protein HETSPECPRED_002190 [Heterodermia speciosa]|uniref:Fe2OG dioxygenase domain-containing protein n=1 Tax=Heterodermia speciosa TaxID=116794 RepID=A0A8H3J3R0_9LECA|nr:MAG: hypothetical protein HETSPECPRED_002190 [Heterodermia speciosa]
MPPSQPEKRKAIHEYFTPATKRVRSDEEPGEIVQQQPPKKCELITSVPGLSLHKSFVSIAEEQQLLAFLNDASWRTDLSRRTMHFGGTYCLMPSKSDSNNERQQAEILQAPSMPIQLSWFVERMVDVGIFQGDRKPQYCIVNEYTENLGIAAHTENFQFGEPVVGLSLLSSCPIRFHELKRAFDGSVRSGKAAKAERTGKVVDVQLPGRSLLVMTGESRWSWQHEIVRSSRGRGLGWRRVSLTFRVK